MEAAEALPAVNRPPRRGVPEADDRPQSGLTLAAEQLLTGGDATITTIAHQVGFSSVSHFVVAFGRHTGITPGHYRATLQTT